jgi:EpsD family peptidyl-prolyl cis-trans isomerase
MTLPLSPRPRRARRIAAARATAIAITVGVALLAGCSKNKDKQSTQVAAKVNKEEITVSQINFLRMQQRALPASQAASANRAILERLIDQELALQKATDQKLDRTPLVVQQIEAARREIISRAYLEKVGEGATKPSADKVEAYYQAHPALFSQRRIYSLQEVNIEATPEQVEALKKTLLGSKSFADFVAYLKANNVKFAAAEAVRAAEQLPLASVDAFGKMKDGQAVFNVRPGGAQVINFAGSRSEPVTLERAQPAIEHFLLNESKREVIADHMAALRAPPTTIEYVREVGLGVPTKASEPVAQPRPVTTLPPALPAAK